MTLRSIGFYVDGLAVPQPRPRAFIRGGHAGVVSNPKKHPVTAFKQHVKIAAEVAYKAPPLEGPLRLKVTFVMPRPKHKLWKTKRMPREWHFAFPDFDNLVKALMDPLKGIIWVDDGQVCVTEIRKFIAAGSEQPHTSIFVEQLEHEDREPT